jgi:UDP-N-acetylmuramoyl-tripeptide--D-alanyl-D-alanine ligase
MQAVELGLIRQWTDGHVFGILEPSEKVVGVSTDSRTVRQGELFIALRGESFDGHEYVGQAIAQGAVAAVVDRRWAAGQDAPGGAPLVVVDSTLVAYGDIAASYRRLFDLPVIGVVGSAGKTTTREMTAAVLGRRYRVLRNSGNENNEIGVPRTLLQLDSTHEAVVLELAARKQGDIAYLCSIAQPTTGVLLNVGTAHLEFFGTVERVAQAKGELLGYLDKSSTALINIDSCVVAREAKSTKGRLLGFSLRCESEFRGERLVLDQEGCGHFSLQHIPFQLRIPGRHNVYNALAAAAVGCLHGIPLVEAAEVLATLDPVSRRSQVTRHSGWALLDDSYNANPDSVRAALDLIGVVDAGRRIAVLGDMLELGPGSPELHAAMGRHAAAVGVDLLLATGELSRHTAAAALESGLGPGEVMHFTDRMALATQLRALLRPGDLVLVKGSRSMQLEEVAEFIKR